MLNKNLCRVVGGLTALGIVGTTLPAFAADVTWSGGKLWKDANNNVFYSPGVAAAGTHIKTTMTGANVSKTRSTNACGVFSFKFPALATGTTAPTSLNIDGTATSLTTAATETAHDWICNASTGALTAGPSASAVPSSSNAIVLVGSTYYFFKTPLTSYVVGFSSSIIKSSKVNKCGFFKMTQNASENISSTSTIFPEGASAAVALSAVPLASGDVKCSKLGVVTLPSAWTS